MGELELEGDGEQDNGAKNYYVQRAEKLYGPFNAERLGFCLSNHIFSPDDKISEDKVNWSIISEVFECGDLGRDNAADLLDAGGENYSLQDEENFENPADGGDNDLAVEGENAEDLLD